MRPECTMPGYENDSTMLPTEVGERVRVIAYGGDVRQYHVDHLGTVVAFNRNGHPVLTLDRPPTQNPAKTTITDRYDCARVIDDAGSLIRTNGHSAVLV